MIERLGNVIYWFGVIIALVSMAIGGWISFKANVGYADRYAIVLAVIPALIAFGIGWAARYVLSGRT